MATHPFGPIENQLIVGYYKRGFEPRAVRPCLRGVRRVLVPAPDPDLEYKLVEPVFYGWSPANGNSSSHDFRVAYQFRVDEQQDLLSRGLGYRITFTMPEQEIITDDPATYPKLDAWIVDPFGKNILKTLDTTGFELSKDCRTMPYMFRTNSFSALKHLEVEMTPFNIKVVEKKRPQVPRKAGFGVGRTNDEYSFPTYSPPESPISSQSTNNFHRYRSWFGDLINQADSVEDRDTPHEVRNFLLGFKGVIEFLTSPLFDGDFDDVVMNKLRPSLQFFFGICQEMLKAEPTLFGSLQKDFIFSNFEQELNSFMGEETAYPSKLTRQLVQHAASQWEILSTRDEDLVRRVHSVGQTLDFGPLQSGMPTSFPETLREIMNFCIGEPTNKTLPRVSRFATKNLSLTLSEYRTPILMSSLTSPHQQVFDPAKYCAKKDGAYSILIVPGTDWLLIKFQDPKGKVLSIADLAAIMQHSMEHKQLESVFQLPAVKAHTNESEYLSLESTGKTGVACIDNKNITAKSWPNLNFLCLKETAEKTAKQEAWLTHDLPRPDSNEYRSYGGWLVASLFQSTSCSKIFVSGTASSDNPFSFMSCYQYKSGELTTEATHTFSKPSEGFQEPLRWVESKRKFVYGLVLANYDAIAQAYVYHQYCFQKVQQISKSVWSPWNSHQPQTEWIDCMHLDQTVGLLRLKWLSKNNQREYMIGRLDFK